MSSLGPKHIAFIMDGNARWAVLKNVSYEESYTRGRQTLEQIVDHCLIRGMEYVTVFAFSAENWGRSDARVSQLMDVLYGAFTFDFHTLAQRQVRIQVIGDLSPFDDELQESIQKITNDTAHHTGLTLTIALNYSGKWEIQQAINQAAAHGHDNAHQDKTTFLANLTPESFLTTHTLPDVDLLIRTSGAIRLSNFLLYKLAYAELMFVDCHWPDFTPQILDKCLADFTKRERRFGR
jgi:undecaprenyl diphosphate synthase